MINYLRGVLYEHYDRNIDQALHCEGTGGFVLCEPENIAHVAIATQRQHWRKGE
jgi:hypothetical protein